MMAAFHHMMFVGVLICAFFAGALNQGRIDRLNQAQASLLMVLSVEQLTNIDVRDI